MKGLSVGKNGRINESEKGERKTKSWKRKKGSGDGGERDSKTELRGERAEQQARGAASHSLGTSVPRRVHRGHPGALHQPPTQHRP